MAEMLLTSHHIDRWHVTELRDPPPFTFTATRDTEKNSLRWMIGWTRKECTAKVTKENKLP